MAKFSFARIDKKVLRLLSRRFWGLAFTCVIAAAVFVQLGRQAFPLINDYKTDISRYFGERLGVQIVLASVDAKWEGLRPQLVLNQVDVRSPTGAPVFKIERVSAQLSLVDSLLQWRFAWRQLEFKGFDTSVIQTAEGWSIQGLPNFRQDELVPPNQKITIDDPYDVFLFGRRVSISQAHFRLIYASGDESSFQIPSITLENDADFHRLTASLEVGENDHAFSLLVEGNGDPRSAGFVANGYLEFQHFPTQKVLSALAMTSEKADCPEHQVSSQLWFRSGADSGTTLRGHIQTEGECAISDAAYPFPQRLSAEVVGKLHRQQGWQIHLNQLIARWPEKTSPALSMTISGRPQQRPSMKIQQLQIAPWIDILLTVGLGGEREEEVLRKLNPQGTLNNIGIEFTGREEGYFVATARLDKGNVDGFLGVPTIRNMGGTISASLLQGRFDVDVKDGLSVDLSHLYNAPLTFAQAEGVLRWKVDLSKRATYIGSDLLTVTNPTEQGKGYLNMILPFNKEQGEQEMTLAIGVNQTLATNLKKYVPKTIPKHLYQWLDTSVKDGRIANVRFLYHGSLEKNAVVKPSIQLYGEMLDGTLVFDPQWPELQGVSGNLTLDNKELDVRIKTASLRGNSVFDAQIQLVDDPTVSGSALSIKGSVASDVDSAMALLKNSPIKKHIGSTFDEWVFSGGMSAEVELLIPLNAESTGVSHKIGVSLKQANLSIPNLNLDINKISGKLRYQSNKGIFSKQLIGEIWGRPFKARIANPKNSFGERDTEIHFSGSAAIENLRSWARRPELIFARGSSEVQGRLFIPSEKNNKTLEFSFNSNLKGTAIELPTPFAKSAKSPTEFLSRIRFYPDKEEYFFQMGEALRFTLLNEHNNRSSALLEINNFDEKDMARRAPIKATGRFDVYGQLSFFDLQQWIEVKTRYFSQVNEEAAQNSDREKENTDPFDVHFALAIDRFLLGTFEIDNIEVVGERKPPLWQMRVESELMSGLVTVPEDDRPLGLNLKHLHIAKKTPVETSASEEQASSSTARRQSVLAGIDLTRALPLDFNADEFWLGDANYGAWSFQLRPVDEGIKLTHIKAHSKGMKLGSQEDDAEFLWLKDPATQQHLSEFKGTIRADNLANVFEAWGQDKLLESEKAVITINAHWSGAPDEVTLKSVLGAVEVDIAKGSFNRGAGSDENAFLRLLGLFNFDTILRRLRLDFSDLAAQGYAYDRLRGKLVFRDGKMYLTEPLIVESSSSYVQLAGTVDLLNESLDSEMVVTLPVAGNAAVATAVVLGLPAALGVYVMSKLFKKQVDAASTINVDVTGSWQNPKISVKKIFDIDAAKRRSKKVRENSERDTDDADELENADDE